MKGFDVIIIGGGVSGLLAAITSARVGDNTLLVEKYDHLGKKLLATGNGRCNLMNKNPPVYYGSLSFALSVLGRNYINELTEFWQNIGLLLCYDAEGRGYPCTYSASTVLDVLTAELKHLNVHIKTGCSVEDVYHSADGFLVKTSTDELFSAKRIIMSTGGAAQPKLGGNSQGLDWLINMGHTVEPFRPVLTPLIADKRSVSGLAGIRTKCSIAVWNNHKLVHQEKGELLFTEKGISGICSMQCARFIIPGQSICSLNLVSDIYQSEDDLINNLYFRKKLFKEESPVHLLRGLCVPKLAFAVCKQAELPLRGETNFDLDSSDLHRIAAVLQGYQIKILGLEGFSRAQVSAGGVSCSEVNPRTMESRLLPGLHITGELLDIDGDCGGYNLMFACMSGIRAGQNGRKINAC